MAKSSRIQLQNKRKRSEVRMGKSLGEVTLQPREGQDQHPKGWTFDLTYQWTFGIVEAVACCPDHAL